MSIIQNKKAFHDFFIEEKYEAGIMLEGWEVKAIRAGRAQLKEAYVTVKDGALYLFGSHISPLLNASTHIHPDPVRTPQTVAAQAGNRQDHRQGAARRLHADAAGHALQGRPRQNWKSASPKAKRCMTKSERT